MTLPISSCSHRLLQAPPSRSATLRWSSEDRRDPRHPRDPNQRHPRDQRHPRRGRRWQLQTLIPGPERRWKRWEWTWHRWHHWGLRIFGFEMCTLDFCQALQTKGARLLELERQVDRINWKNCHTAAILRLYCSYTGIATNESQSSCEYLSSDSSVYRLHTHWSCFHRHYKVAVSAPRHAQNSNSKNASNSFQFPDVFNVFLAKCPNSVESKGLCIQNNILAKSLSNAQWRSEMTMAERQGSLNLSDVLIPYITSNWAEFLLAQAPSPKKVRGCTRP